MTDSGHSIGEVAALAHITVRTLHHYDSIGLLRPSQRTARRSSQVLRGRPAAAARGAVLP